MLRSDIYADLDKRIAVFGFLCDCPYRHRLRYCPLSVVSQMPLKARLRWLQIQSDEDIDNIVSLHLTCPNYEHGT